MPCAKLFTLYVVCAMRSPLCSAHSALSALRYALCVLCSAHSALRHAPCALLYAPRKGHILACAGSQALLAKVGNNPSLRKWSPSNITEARMTTGYISVPLDPSVWDTIGSASSICRMPAINPCKTGMIRCGSYSTARYTTIWS